MAHKRNNEKENARYRRGYRFCRGLGLSSLEANAFRGCSEETVLAILAEGDTTERFARVRVAHNAHVRRRATSPAGRVLNNERNRRMRLLYPEKFKAREIFRAAVNASKVIQEPCEVCGNLKSQGHHDDYSKPLAVKWLCQKHHCELEGRWNPKT